MAMKVFGLERKYCEDKAYSPDGSFQPRRAIKSVLLGIMYGMSSRGLAENVGVSVERAEEIIEDFYAAYPKVRSWMDASIKFAEENEYIETLYNRKRRFPGFRSLAAAYHKVVAKIERMTGEPLPKNIWEADLPYSVKKEYWEVAGKYAAITRQVVNTRIQGSAADVMKLAMIAAYELCKRKGWKMIATIHDEILFEMPIDVTEPEIEELEQKMKSVVTLSVPMKVDTAFMPERWGVEVSKQKWYGGDAA
jgi:DNA polymerase-1